LSSPSKVSTLLSFARRTIISSFSTLTYGGSLYLQKKTRISFDNVSGRFCKSKLMLRRATHWTSGAEEMRVTGVSLFAPTTFRRTQWRRHFSRQVLDQILPLDILDVYHYDLYVRDPAQNCPRLN